MKRIAFAFAVVAMLAVGAAEAPAQVIYGRTHIGTPHRSFYGPGHHHGYYAPHTYTPHYYGPRVWAPHYVPVYPRHHYYAPGAGFHYRGRGLSFGFGF